MANQFKTLSDLSKDDIKDFKNQVINLIEAEANLFSVSSLIALLKMSYIWLVFAQKPLHNRALS